MRLPRPCTLPRTLLQRAECASDWLLVGSSLGEVQALEFNARLEFKRPLHHYDKAARAVTMVRRRMLHVPRADGAGGWRKWRAGLTAGSRPRRLGAVHNDRGSRQMSMGARPSTSGRFAVAIAVAFASGAPAVLEVDRGKGATATVKVSAISTPEGAHAHGERALPGPGMV